MNILSVTEYMQGNRREHRPAGVYMTITGLVSEPKMLVSEDLGLEIGFDLHKSEATAEGTTLTYRLIGANRGRTSKTCNELLYLHYRPATEEERIHINHRACET